MLHQSTVDQIAILLAEDRLSLRQIAARLGVSHTSVANIAKGKRGTHGSEADCMPLGSTLGRCPTCGAKVYLPCVACQARAYRRRRLQQRGCPTLRPGEPIERPRVA